MKGPDFLFRIAALVVAGCVGRGLHSAPQAQWPAVTVFRHPFQLQVRGLVKPGRNRLELEVTNLPANRIIKLDRDQVQWKKFYDINFVSMTGAKFNAADWPLFPSGLLGPVRLIPEQVRP